MPDVIHPLYATDAVSTRVGRLLYSPLVDFDDSQRPVPDLATWERLSPTHYLFTLGENPPRFSDGRILSADDVVATYRFVLDADNASPHRGLLSVIEAIHAKGDRVIEFRLSRPDPHFPAYLTLGIVPAHSLRGQVSKDQPPLGSGPFIRSVSKTQESLLLIRRRDGQVVEFVAARDPLVRLLKLLRGEIHLLQNDLPPELFGRLAQEPDVSVIEGAGSNYSYLGFNLEHPLTGDIAIRRAIAHAIDRPAIIRYLFRNRATPAQSLFPESHWLGLPLPARPYDPGEARRLLSEAGYSVTNPLRLEYKTSSDPFRLRVATVIQAQLAQVGIQLEIKSYDWGTFYGDIKNGDFQMYSLTWVGMKSPDSFRYLFHSGSVPPKGANRGRYRSEDADRLIEAGEAARQPAEQVNLYHQLQHVLLEELPYVPLWYEDNVAAVRDEITGYQLAADGNYDGLTEVHWRSL